MKLSNMRIGLRLALGFGIQIALMTVAITVGIVELDTIDKLLEDVTQDNNVKLGAATEMRTAQLNVTIAASRIVLLSDPAEKAEQERALKDARAHYDHGSKILEAKTDTEQGRRILASIDAARDAARPLIDRTVQLGQDGKTDEGTQVLVKEAGPATAKWQAALGAMVDYQETHNHQAEKESTAAYERARTILLGIGTLAVLMGALVAWLATRSIVQPIRRAVAIAQTVASGNLDSEIDSTSGDETGELLRALGAMNTSLRDIVGQVRSGTETIASATSQIASGNLELSSRTEQQASSLEETAASMEELNTTVQQNADNARQANAMALSASAVAAKGGAVVAQVVQTMSSINDSSRKIVDIIAVIDGIAFQTNILALNAAVEAARAGEQGRGFAVVASEVRNLAHRSASAAKEIKQLIDDSVDKVALGSTLVNNAGHTMDEVVESVRRVTDIMAEISAAGHEQQLGIAQINQAIIEMDTVTQQNAALVEEAAAAAESLQDQAGQLSGVVSIFSMGGAPGARPAPALRHAAPVRTLAPSRPVRPLPRERLRVANGAPADMGDWEEF